jgi:RNA polymerase sigma-70 factor, ECF subfamily
VSTTLQGAALPTWRTLPSRSTTSVLSAHRPSDETLVLAVQRRDERALAELLRRHGAWAARFAERITGSPELAEEVVQSAFLRVWDKADGWQGKARFTTWFYRILHNLCVDRMRLRRIGFEVIDEHFEDPAPSAEERLESEQRGARVRGALAELPARQRMALVLSHYEECSQRDAAAIMGITEGALESLLVRARAALRDRLRAEYGGTML